MLAGHHQSAAGPLLQDVIQGHQFPVQDTIADLWRLLLQHLLNCTAWLQHFMMGSWLCQQQMMSSLLQESLQDTSWAATIVTAAGQAMTNCLPWEPVLLQETIAGGQAWQSMMYGTCAMASSGWGYEQRQCMCLP